METENRIKIEVRGKVATLKEQNFQLVGGNNDYEVVFDFDEAWDGHNVKTAIFVFGNRSVFKVFEGNTCEGVAIENATICYIGVFSGNIVTTTAAQTECVLQSITDIGGKPTDPTPSVYDQIIALLNKYIEQSQNSAVSPTVKIEAIENGHRIIITDINGDHSFDVLNGKDGEQLDPNLYYDKEEIDNKFSPITTELSQNSQNIARNEKRITNLEKQLPASVFYTDDTASFEKQIPENVCPWAQLNYIGGRTYRSTNILPFPYTNMSATHERLEITVYEDGRVVKNGYTSTEYPFVLFEGRIDLKPNTYYIPSRCNVVLNTGFIANKKFMATANEYIVKVTINSPAGSYYDSNNPNHSYYPQINEGQSVLPYEKGGDVYGLIYASVSEFVIQDKDGAKVGGFEIPDYIMRIRGYGESNPINATRYNKLDFEKKQLVINGYIEDGKWIEYYNNPVRYDLSNIITDDMHLILVSGGGKIKTVNERELAVPSSITYMLREV